MSVKTVITDDEGQSLEFELTQDNELYIGAGNFYEDNGIKTGHVTLNKEHVIQLIKRLTELKARM